MFSNQVAPYLINLRDNFTRYQLSKIAHLKSNYSIRLFELLRQFEFKQERVISLEELRIMLQIEDKYKDFRDLNKRILKPAIDELNQKTHYAITIQTLKTLRRVTHIQFYFSIVT